MDRREHRLAMGYLIKSPVKSRDKAAFGKFWKLRWLVLTKVHFVDVNEIVEDSRLVFAYYKDKESHANDEPPKGTLNISHCNSIKSCFQPQASYHHSFTMEFDDGKIVRFSAPSCEKKFKWVSLLYNYRFGNKIEALTHALGIPGTQSSQQSQSQKRSSICSNDISISRVRSASGYSNGRNSIIFSPSDTVGYSSEEPPALPPRRPSGLSGNQNIFNHNDTPSPTRSSMNHPIEIDLSLLQVFNDLFMLCIKCQPESQKKSGFQRKKRASKKWAGQPEDVEVRQEFASKYSSQIDSDAISQFSNNSDDYFAEDSYTKIDEILLEKVKNLQEKAEKASKDGDELKDKLNSDDTGCENRKETEDVVGNALIHEEAVAGESAATEDVYMVMNNFEQECPPQVATQNGLSNADSDSAESKQEHGYNGNMKQFFEMKC